MENFKGTKGEWVVQGDFHPQIFSETKSIAAVNSQITGFAYNAKLIAAAPEMLNQLNEVLSYLNSMPKFEAENMLYFKIASIIKKATE
jgi:hypothetical protein